MSASTPVDPAPRGRKDLESTAAATAYQKAFGAELRERVVERGEPFALAQADTPHEIFHAMDIPVISNQWWSAYISAKRLSGRYFEVMDNLGYPSNRCRYCSLGLACSLADDPAIAPWGGCRSPPCWWRGSPAIAPAGFTQWAEVMQTEFFAMEHRRGSARCRNWFRHRATAGTKSISR